MDPRVSLDNIALLNKLAAPDLQGFIRSAYTGDLLNKDYVQKNSVAYAAFLETAAFVTVKSILKGTSDLSPDKLKQDLTVFGLTPAEGDLASMITQMTFSSDATPKLPAEEDDLDVEIDESTLYNVSDYVGMVAKVYQHLYSSVFDPLRPKGAYSPSPDTGYIYGIIKHHTQGADGKPGCDSFISPSGPAMDRLSVIYKGLINGGNITDSNNVSALALGSNPGLYFSSLAGRLASGVLKSGGSRYSDWESFEKDLLKLVSTKLGLVSKAYADKSDVEKRSALKIAAENLATAFVVAEFDPIVSNLLVLKICAPSINLRDDKGAIQKLLTANNFGSSEVRSIVSCKSEATDIPVCTVVVALKSALERSAPMFAYQVWDELAKNGDIASAVSTKNIIFGRRQDGSMLTYDMLEGQANIHHNMSAVAKSRSGKGLTTLATLAATAVAGQPIFYLDCKPDMTMLLQEYMASVGQPSRLFAYDAIGEVGPELARKPIAGSNAERYSTMNCLLILLMLVV